MGTVLEVARMQGKVEELMADLFQVDRSDVTDAFAMKDTSEWDSLKHMELVFSVEQTFGVDLAFEDIVAMQTVGDIKRVLREKGVNGEHGVGG
jgi:acyl carrier protein